MDWMHRAQPVVDKYFLTNISIKSLCYCYEFETRAQYAET